MKPGPASPRKPVAGTFTKWQPLELHQAAAGDSYALLPFRFTRLDSTRYFLSNFAGEYHLLTRDELPRLVRHELPLDSDTYRALKSKHFVLDGDSTVAIELLASQYRTRQSFLARFTSLFMFVTTLRCDHACTYCQVSSRSGADGNVDMPDDVVTKGVEFMFRSPSPTLKVEFQGGESLLHFDAVREIVRLVEERNALEGRDISFVITSNLSALSDGILDFCKAHNVAFSTSLDGPREIHNANRPRPGHDSYDEAVKGIRRVQEALGPERISALMTATRASLAAPVGIVDEYVRQGFRSIFLRSLNPYGRAADVSYEAGYTTEEWLEFYTRCMAHIIELNLEGIAFTEEFSALVLTRLLTSYPTGFVDLQSPAGLGISGIVINYDGAVYPSDEARMLAEMGDRKFRLGSVLTDSYEEIMLSPVLFETLRATTTEGMPGCADCGFQPYCGSDPVRHYRMQGDFVGLKPRSDFCKKMMGIIRHLVLLLEDGGEAARVLRRWA